MPVVSVVSQGHGQSFASAMIVGNGAHPPSGTRYWIFYPRPRAVGPLPDRDRAAPDAGCVPDLALGGAHLMAPRSRRGGPQAGGGTGPTAGHVRAGHRGRAAPFMAVWVDPGLRP